MQIRLSFAWCDWKCTTAGGAHDFSVASPLRTLSVDVPIQPVKNVQSLRFLRGYTKMPRTSSGPLRPQIFLRNLHPRKRERREYAIFKPLQALVHIGASERRYWRCGRYAIGHQRYVQTANVASIQNKCSNCDENDKRLNCVCAPYYCSNRRYSDAGDTTFVLRDFQ